mmetsp:Transcript_13329/g.28829  ORF Transcript_13329/g.28829 Transcript_13329/m.28829 type:complete len:249 (+) Transcript_13329:843-1589(+)
MFRFLASSMRKSRSLFALPISVSQKPFLVASAVDSASSLSISSWMRPLIFLNGSDCTFMARAERTGLLRRLLSFFSRSTTRATRAWVDILDEALRRALALLTVAASCTNATLCVCGAIFWSRARLFASESASFTLDWMTSRAPVSAASSSLRMAERWSQSWALSSHCAVRSLRYSWSSFRTPSVSTSVPRSVAILDARASMSFVSCFMAASLEAIIAERSLIVSSRVFFAFSQSVSSCIFSLLNSVLS